MGLFPLTRKEVTNKDALEGINPPLQTGKRATGIGEEGQQEGMTSCHFVSDPVQTFQQKEKRPFAFTLPLSDQHKPKAKGLTVIAALSKASRLETTTRAEGTVAAILGDRGTICGSMDPGDGGSCDCRSYSLSCILKWPS